MFKYIILLGIFIIVVLCYGRELKNYWHKLIDFLRNKAWDIWMSVIPIWFIGLVALIFTIILLATFGTTDTLDIIIKIADFHKKIITDIKNNLLLGIIGYASLYFVLPSIFILAIGLLIKYYLVFPDNANELLRKIAQRHSREVKHLARGLIRAEIADITALVDSAGNPKTPYEIATYKVPRYAKDIVKATDAKQIYMTTLITPLELYMDGSHRMFTKEFMEQIDADGKNLVRICVATEKDFAQTELDNFCESQKQLHASAIDAHTKNGTCKSGCGYGDKALEEHKKQLVFFEDNKKAINWFKLAHAKSTVYYIEKSCFKGCRPLELENNRLDVLLFDGNVIFALEHDPETLKIKKDKDKFERPTLKLHLIEDDTNLGLYKTFFRNLIERAAIIR